MVNNIPTTAWDGIMCGSVSVPLAGRDEIFKLVIRERIRAPPTGKVLGPICGIDWRMQQERGKHAPACEEDRSSLGQGPPMEGARPRTGPKSHNRPHRPNLVQSFLS
jgi:hypothetical protein